jgi:hypothetical protein
MHITTMRHIKAIRRNSHEEELPAEKRKAPRLLYILKTEATCEKGGLFSQVGQEETLTKEDGYGRVRTFYR